MSELESLVFQIVQTDQQAADLMHGIASRRYQQKGADVCHELRKLLRRGVTGNPVTSALNWLDRSLEHALHSQSQHTTSTRDTDDNSQRGAWHRGSHPPPRQLSDEELDAALAEFEPTEPAGAA